MFDGLVITIWFNRNVDILTSVLKQMKLVSISTILLNHIVITKPSKSSAETNEISQYIHITIYFIWLSTALCGLVITICFNRRMNIITNFICFSIDLWWLGYNDMVQQKYIHISVEPYRYNQAIKEQC
jgi:hypothetical protein